MNEDTIEDTIGEITKMDMDGNSIRLSREDEVYAEIRMELTKFKNSFVCDNGYEFFCRIGPYCYLAYSFWV